MGMVIFVRRLRTTNMRYGIAVDKAGKRWRGFYSNKTPDEVRATASLGSVGLCLSCGNRVYEGWECLKDRRDVCVNCVVDPPEAKNFVIEQASEEEWATLQKEFYRNAHFNHERRDGSSDRPSEEDRQRQ
jgi:hypothetical protein